MDSSKQAQRTVIQFLSAEGVSGTDILYSRMKMCMEVSVCHVVQFSDGVVIFVMDVWVQRTCRDEVRMKPRTFFADGIHRLVDQWDTCFNQQGDYV